MRKKYTNLRLDDEELPYEIKLQSIKEGKTMIEFVQQVMWAYINKKRKY